MLNKFNFVQYFLLFGESDTVFKYCSKVYM